MVFMKNVDYTPVVNLLTSPAWEDYRLLDSGNGRKLEQFGPYRLIRPEAEAVWSPLLKTDEWQKASAEFIPSAEENGGHWKLLKQLPDSWKIRYRGLTFKIMLSNSKQLGIFPEQEGADFIRAGLEGHDNGADHLADGHRVLPHEIVEQDREDAERGKHQDHDF